MALVRCDLKLTGPTTVGHEWADWDEATDEATCECGYGHTRKLLSEHIDALAKAADAPDMLHSLALP